MKKTNIIIALLFIIIAGLIIFIVTLKNNKTPSNISSFEKQERCANNRENAKKRLDESYKIATPYFYDIFYSPKTDTCVYTYGLVLSGVAPKEIGKFVIADYFSGKTLYDIKYDNSSGDEKTYSYTVRPEFESEEQQYH